MKTGSFIQSGRRQQLFLCWNSVFPLFSFIVSLSFPETHSARIVISCDREPNHQVKILTTKPAFQGLQGLGCLPRQRWSGVGSAWCGLCASFLLPHGIKPSIARTLVHSSSFPNWFVSYRPNKMLLVVVAPYCLDLNMCFDSKKGNERRVQLEAVGC